MVQFALLCELKCSDVKNKINLLEIGMLRWIYWANRKDKLKKWYSLGIIMCTSNRLPHEKK